MAIAARIDDEGRVILPDPLRSMLPKETSIHVEIREAGSWRLILSPSHVSTLSLLVDAAKEPSDEHMTLEDVLTLVEEASEQVYRETYGKPELPTTAHRHQCPDYDGGNKRGLRTT